MQDWFAPQQLINVLLCYQFTARKPALPYTEITTWRLAEGTLNSTVRIQLLEFKLIPTDGNRQVFYSVLINDQSGSSENYVQVLPTTPMYKAWHSHILAKSSCNTQISAAGLSTALSDFCSSVKVLTCNNPQAHHLPCWSQEILEVKWLD